MGLLIKIADKLEKRKFVKEAIRDRADLTAFKEPPSARVIIGISLILLSYLIGWPAVAFFGIIAIYFENPLIVIIGGPLIYGFSYIVLFAGTYLAGAKYVKEFLRWAIRIAVERLRKNQ